MSQLPQFTTSPMHSAQQPQQTHPYRLLPPKNRYIQRGVLLYSLLLLFLHSLHFLLVYPTLENPEFSLMSWVFLAIASVFSILMVLLREGQISLWALIVAYLLVIVVIAYDVRGAWYGESLLEQLTAAYAVTAIVLMLMVSVNYHLAVVTIALYGLGILVLAQLHSTKTLITQTHHATVFLFSLATMVLVFLLVERYRQMLENQLNRIHASGTFVSPRLALGKDFGNEIVKLDGAAEELLSRVATGNEPLPLNPAAAKRAGEIAQRLRATLVQGHSQTWLDHAVQDHYTLRDWVRVEDPQQLIGLLNPEQRHSLFNVIWQLVHPKKQPSTVIEVVAQALSQAATTGTHHAPTPAANTDYYLNPRQEERFTLSIRTELQSRQFNPIIWLELATLGNYHTSNKKLLTTITVEFSIAPHGEANSE